MGIQQPGLIGRGGQPIGSDGAVRWGQKKITVALGLGISIEMVLIPAGEFLMGSPDSFAWNNEKPQHRVRITKPFYLGVTPVTQEQWQMVMGLGCNPSRFKGPQRPVGGVSWGDVPQFLERLSGKLGAGGGRYRLPTEAEWEYSCRAGSETRYCYGDDQERLGEYAWYEANSKIKTRPVGLKKPNAWGLYDMHGNVWEWCSDWYDEHYYEKSPVDDPKGPSVGSCRVARGGSFRLRRIELRCACRVPRDPSYPSFDDGFRVVCER